MYGKLKKTLAGRLLFTNHQWLRTPGTLTINDLATFVPCKCRTQAFGPRRTSSLGFVRPPLIGCVPAPQALERLAHIETLYDELADVAAKS